MPKIHIKLSSKSINSGFVKKIEELSGENLKACYQCGKCSAGCPFISSMDILPNQVIRLIQLGQEKEVLNCKTIWLCASCFTCQARCPKGVSLTKIMEAIRLITLRKNIDHIKVEKLEEGKVGLPQIAMVCSFRKNTG